MSQFVRRIARTGQWTGPSFPQLDIELTERCNNDCIHCCVNLPADDRAAQGREMTTAQVKAVLDQAAAAGCLQVRLTGGEPLLRGDFEEIYLHARRAGLKVVVFTNGSLITQRTAELFATVPPLEPIDITVYGMHRTSYEGVTRKAGSFTEFRKGVQLLLEHKVPFTVKSALLPQNRAETDELEAWARAVTGMSGRPRYAMFFDLRYRRDDEAKNRCIRALRVPPETGVALLGRSRAVYAKELMQFSGRFMGPQGDRLFSCGAGCNVCVDAYGFAQPCLPLRVPELTYDLFQAGASLQEARGRFRKLRDLRAENREYLERCARCFLKGLCEQCPARAWAEHGTLDTPVEYLCEVAHVQARDMGWLRAGEHAWEVARWRERLEPAGASDDRLCGSTMQ